MLAERDRKSPSHLSRNWFGGFKTFYKQTARSPADVIVDQHTWMNDIPCQPLAQLLEAETERERNEGWSAKTQTIYMHWVNAPLEGIWQIQTENRKRNSASCEHRIFPQVTFRAFSLNVGGLLGD